MAFPSNPKDRLPRGDKNRRLSLGVSRELMAEIVGITVGQLHEYEHTQPDRRFSLEIAERLGNALELLEATRTPRVRNGPVPHHAD